MCLSHCAVLLLAMLAHTGGDTMAAPVKSYDEILKRYAEEFKVPFNEVRALMMVESGGKPGAKSPKGAIGPMQLMPPTAQDLGVNPYDDEQNIKGGVKYYAQLRKNFKSPVLAAAAYNAGPKNVQDYGGIPPFKETLEHSRRFQAQLDKVPSAALKQPETPTAGRMVRDIGKDYATDIAKTEIKNRITQQINPADILTSEEAAKLGMSNGPAGASTAAAPGAFSLSGIGSAGNAILPIAGAIGAYDLFKNDREGVRGYLQGAGSGAALGAYGGPVGAAIGAGVGLGAVGIRDAFFSPPKTQEEEKRWGNLQKQGLQIPDWVKNDIDIKAKDAGYRGDLGANFVGNAPTAGKSSGSTADAAGNWVNNKFAKSRNVADLTGKDIWGYADFSEKFGPNWMNTSESNREAIANKALEMGIVSEGKGTINLKNDKGFMDYANSLLATPQPQTGGGTSGTSTGGKPSSFRPRPQGQPDSPFPVFPIKPLRPTPALTQPRPMGYNPTEDIVGVNEANKVKNLPSLYNLYRR